MTETAIMIGTLLAPLLAAWALHRAFRPAQWPALIPLAMFVVNLCLVITDASCEGGGSDAPWSQCAIPGLAGFSNPLTTVYYYNLSGIISLTPAMLIIAGIAALIRREGHQT